MGKASEDQTDHRADKWSLSMENDQGQIMKGLQR